MDTKNLELFNKLETNGFTQFIGLTKEEYLREVDEWQKRDVSKEIEEQIKNDCLIYCNYIIDVLSKKKKFNLEEAKRLHQNVTRWKAKDFPLKK